MGFWTPFLSNNVRNFTKTGNPNGAGLPEWKTYDKQAGNIMVLGDKVEIKKGLFI